MLDINKIYNGDCLKIMKDIDDKSIDCIICDLPYGVTDCEWDNIIPFEDLWQEYNRIIKDNGAIVLFGTEPFTSKLICSNIKNFKCCWYWNKEMPVGHLSAKYKPMSIIENISVFSKDGKRVNYYPQMTSGKKYNVKHYKKHKTIYGVQNNDVVSCSDLRYPKNVLVYNNANRRNKIHPTEKPIELLEYLIKTYSLEGQLILDNCCGSGTTLHAAKNLNRNYIGIELTEFYFNVANLRLDGQPYLHLKTKDRL